MPFYPCKDGETYLYYLERVELYPDREPLPYERVMELKREWDREYERMLDELETGRPSLDLHDRIRRLERELAV